ncbi:MAG: redoxin domain-containing protein [Candidatus Aminicenantes bacterium]|nr:redoxin domain-containing protein [Candidatus Aminicenantes bacterium]
MNPKPEKQTLYLVVLTLALGVLSLTAQTAHPEPQTLAIGEKAPDFRLPGTDDRTWSLEDFKPHKLLVVVFSCNHCPTAQAYEERLIGVCLDYKEKGVGMVMISPNSPKALNLAELGYTDLGDTLEDMKIRAKDKKFPFPYLYDGDDQKASIAYGPVATPHVFIFDQNRRLQYAGRVDDKEKPGSGKAEDLRNALDALLAGRNPSPATTKVFGCSIKWAWKDEYTKKLYKEWAGLPIALEPIDLAAVKELLANTSKKLRLINIWATWCAPCTAEFPELVTTDSMYRGRDFEFISISADKADRRGRALEFLKKNQASNKNYIYTGESIYPLIETIDPVWQGALPYTLLVEPGGKIVYRCQELVDPLALRKAIVEHPLLGRYY